MRRMTVIAFVALVGCSPKNVLDESGEGDDDWDTAGDAGATDTGELEHFEVPYWRLDGSIVVEDGQAVAAQSEVELTLISQNRYELCGAVASVESAVTEATVPDETVFAWWTLSLTAPTSDTCGEVLVEGEGRLPRDGVRGVGGPPRGQVLPAGCG